MRQVAVLAVALLGTGCTLLTATPPQVEVQRVELRDGSLLDQVLAVSLCVTNPNDAELAFRRVAVAVDVSGTPLADSASDSAVRLPPRSSVLVPFTVVATTRNLGPQLLGVLRTGGVDYRMHGTVQLGVWGATERKTYARAASSASVPDAAGFRRGRSSPRATASGRVKA